MHYYPKVSRNNKVAELKDLSQSEFLDRVVNYPDQDVLNYDEDGKRRKFPIGYSAEKMQENGFPNDASYHGMLNGYATITTPDIKVVGVSFRQTDLDNVVKDKQQHTKGVNSYYHANFRLVPEPENEYDPNAIKVEIESENDTYQHVGYIPRELAEKYDLGEAMDVEGTIIDFSNGKLKNVSYRVPLDTEAVTIRQEETQDMDLDEFSIFDYEDLDEICTPLNTEESQDIDLEGFSDDDLEGLDDICTPLLK